MPESAPSLTWIASTSALLRPASSSAMSRMLIAMESSCMTSLGAGTDDASPALPADLENFAIFDQDGNRALACCRAHASECFGVGIDFEFKKFTTREFEPLAHLGCVRTAGRAEKFKHV